MKILYYVKDVYFFTEEEGLVPAKNAIIAEDANRPGDFVVFDTEEECTKFCENMNSEEGTAFFKLRFDAELWNTCMEQEFPKRLKKIGRYFLHDGMRLEDGTFCDLDTIIYDDNGKPVWFNNKQKCEVVELKYAGGCEIEYFDTWACDDANHWGVVFESRDKEKLQKFSEFLEWNGAAMSDISPAKQTDRVICDIDKEWNGSNEANPFYFWYYGARDTDGDTDGDEPFEEVDNGEEEETFYWKEEQNEFTDAVEALYDKFAR